MIFRAGPSLWAAILLVVPLFGQGRAAVFFPRDEELEIIADDLEELLDVDRPAPTRERVAELLNAIIARPSRSPVHESPAYAISPWLLLGRLWPRFTEAVRQDARRRILEHVSAGDGPARAEDGPLARIFFSLPDQELRRQIGPALAYRLLEAGRLGQADRCFRILSAGAEGEAAESYALGQIAASRLAGRGLERPLAEPDMTISVDELDPDMAQIHRRIMAEDGEARQISAGPWQGAAQNAMPGSLRARFPLFQSVSLLAGAGDRIYAHCPVAVGSQAYVFNGSDLVSLDILEARERWRFRLPPPRSDLRNTVLAPAADRFSVYVSTCDKVARIRARDGSTAWCRHLSIDEQGDPSWSEVPPETVASALVTPPVISAGKLFLGVVLPAADQTSAYLAAFFAEGGEPAWLTRVGSTESRDFLGLGSSPLPLACSRGRIYFCTNTGFVAAVDEADGAIHYLRTYPRLDVLASEYSIRREDRWRLPPPAVWRGLLILAPQDANEILALDLWDGGLRFRIKRSEGDYFLGPVEDQLYLVGKTLRRISLESGLPGPAAYSVELPDRPIGRGQILDRAVALPYRDRLLLLDPETGNAFATHMWETPQGGGNILATISGLLVAHGRGVDLYRHLGEDRAEIETVAIPAELRRLKRAQLALKTGDFQNAFGELETYVKDAARYVSAEETRGRIQVAQLLAAWLELGLPPDVQLRLCEYKSTDIFSLTDREAVSALLSQASLYERTGDLRREIASLYSAAERAHRANERGKQAQVNVAWGLEVPALQLVTARIEDAIQRSGSPPGLLSEIEAQARQELARAEAIARLQAVQAVMRKYPFTRPGQEAFLRCAQMHLANQNSAEAQDVLTEYIHTYREGDLAVEAMLLLGGIFESGGQIGKAQELYAVLADRYPDRKIEREGREVSAGAWARQKIALLAPQLGLGEPPALELPLGLAWFTRTDLLDRTSSLRFLPIEQQNPKGYLAVRGESFVRVYDGLRGRLLCAVKAPEYCDRAGLLEAAGREILILKGRTSIAGIDPQTGEQIFEPLSVGEKDRPLTYIGDVAFLGSRLVCLSGARLLCLESSGEALWEAKLPGRGREPVIVCGDTIAVFDASAPFVYFVQAENGLLDAPLDLAAPAQRISSPPCPIRGRFAFAVYGREILLVDCSERKAVWRKTLDREVPRACKYLGQHADRVYVWGRPLEMGGCRLLAIDLATGATIWSEYSGAGDPVLDLAAFGQDLVLLCGDSTRALAGLSVVGSAVTKAWRRRLYDSLERAEDLIAIGGTVFHGDQGENRIVAVSARTGTVLEESIREVRQFLDGRLLRDWRLAGESFFVLTERGLGCFRFSDRYQPGRSMESLILATARDEREPSLSAAEAPRELGQRLLSDGEPGMALRFLDQLLWERWPIPRSAPDLWFLLGAAQEAAARVDRQVIRCLPAPADIAIDGYLSERWPIGTSVRLDTPKAVMPIQWLDGLTPAWKGAEDLSANLFCAWDEVNFYFALDVRDSIVLPHDSEAQRWIGDCLVIDIDPEGDGGLFPSGDDQMLTLFLSVRQQQNKAGEDGEKRKPPGEYKVRVTDDRSGVIYEVAVPWSSLGFDPENRAVEPGAAFGFNVVVTDDDIGTGARQALSLNASHLLGWERDRAWEGLVPDYFPKIVLEGGQEEDR